MAYKRNSNSNNEKVAVAAVVGLAVLILANAHSQEFMSNFRSLVIGLPLVIATLYGYYRLIEFLWSFWGLKRSSDLVMGIFGISAIAVFLTAPFALFLFLDDPSTRPAISLMGAALVTICIVITIATRGRKEVHDEGHKPVIVYLPAEPAPTETSKAVPGASTKPSQSLIDLENDFKWPD